MPKKKDNPPMQDPEVTPQVDPKVDPEVTPQVDPKVASKGYVMGDGVTIRKDY